MTNRTDDLDHFQGQAEDYDPDVIAGMERLRILRELEEIEVEDSRAPRSVN